MLIWIHPVHFIAVECEWSACLDSALEYQADKILHVADQILLNDPCNSLALSYKVKILMTQGKVKSAHYVYDKFCALYQEMYGESYPVAFDNVDPEIVRGYD